MLEDSHGGILFVEEYRLSEEIRFWRRAVFRRNSAYGKIQIFGENLFWEKSRFEKKQALGGILFPPKEIGGIQGPLTFDIQERKVFRRGSAAHIGVNIAMAAGAQSQRHDIWRGARNVAAAGAGPKNAATPDAWPGVSVMRHT
eukprot:364667-Chlamydomonas_euryale.AAC.5